MKLCFVVLILFSYVNPLCAMQQMQVASLANQDERLEEGLWCDSVEMVAKRVVEFAKGTCSGNEHYLPTLQKILVDMHTNNNPALEHIKNALMVTRNKGANEQGLHEYSEISDVQRKTLTSLVLQAAEEFIQKTQMQVDAKDVEVQEKITSVNNHRRVTYVSLGTTVLSALATVITVAATSYFSATKACK